MILMSATYSVVMWKLWSNQIPGERTDREKAYQARIKRKVKHNQQQYFPQHKCVTMHMPQRVRIDSRVDKSEEFEFTLLTDLTNVSGF